MLEAQLVLLLGWCFIIRDERGAKVPEQEGPNLSGAKEDFPGEGTVRGAGVRAAGVCQLETGESLGRGGVHAGAETEGTW